MKQNYLKEIMTALLLLCCTAASAADFEVDGIYYNILSEEDKTVEVTRGSNEYTGEVTIPASVIYNSTTYGVIGIGDGAFAYCSGLTSIEIPSSLTSIGNYAFDGCNGLTSIVVDEGNTIYDSRNNCNAIIETASNTLIIGCKNTIISSSVTSIGSSAFNDCAALTSIDIPSSVTSIGNSAFSGCDGLTSIVIPSSVTSIGNSAFSSCIGLTSIEIPNSVTSIGEYAFSSCIGLTSIEIPNSVTSIGDYAFYDCPSLTSIEIPSSVTSIGNGAFANCSGLTSIEIPNSVTSIGEYAFSDCAALTSIDIPSSVTSIGNDAFFNCDGLTSIEIPSSVTSIGNSAFSSCNGLTSIVIPSSVTSIGGAAFWFCDGLTSIEIPASVTSIGDRAFSHCDVLTSIVVDEGNTVYDSRNNCNAIIETASNTLIAGCVNTIIPSGVTSIGNSAFYRCDGLTSIEIPASVTSIGKYAFYRCDGLTSIEIPAGVTSIGNGAFSGCSGLTSITSHIAAENLFAPGNDAFSRVNKSACTLYVPAGAKSTYESTDGWKEFTNIVETYDLTVTAAGYATLYLGTAVEIPAGVEAYTANRIEGDLLKMQAVEEVIPANTAVIIKAEEGNYSFAYSDETPDAIEVICSAAHSSTPTLSPWARRAHTFFPWLTASLECTRLN